MKKQLLVPIMIALALFGCTKQKAEDAKAKSSPTSGAAGIPAQPTTPSDNSPITPPVTPPTDAGALAPLQWKMGSDARERAAHSLAITYSETQALRLTMRDGLGILPCVLIAALESHHPAEKLTPRLESCADFAERLAAVLQSPHPTVAQFDGIRAPELKLFEGETPPRLPENRREFAEAALPIATALKLLKSPNPPAPAKLREEIAALLASSAAPTFRLFAGAAHDPKASAAWKDIALARLWKRSALLQQNSVALPWSAPTTWQAEIPGGRVIELTESTDYLHRALIDAGTRDSQIEALAARPFLKRGGPALFAELTQEKERAERALFRDFREKRLNLTELHERLKRENEKISFAFRALTFLVGAFDPGAAALLGGLAAIAEETHAGLVDLLGGRTNGRDFLRRFAGAGARAIGFRDESDNGFVETQLRAMAATLTDIQSTLRDRFAGVDAELARLSTLLTESHANLEAGLADLANRLAIASANAHAGNIALLRQTLEVSRERCLGENSALARTGRFGSEEQAAECKSDAASRATKLAFEPAVSGEWIASAAEAATVSSDLATGWLGKRLGITFASASANPLDWSTGAGDFAYLFFASADSRTETFAAQRILSAGRGIQALTDQLSDPEIAKSAWDSYVDALAKAAEELKRAAREFGQAELAGIDPVGFPASLSVVDPKENLVDVSLRLGIASFRTEHREQLLTEHRTPHSYNMGRQSSIFVLMEFSDYVTATIDGRTVELGVGRFRSNFSRCMYLSPPPCISGQPNPNCGEELYHTVLSDCRTIALRDLSVLERQPIDVSAMETALAPEIRRRLASSTRSFADFARTQPAVKAAIADLAEKYALATALTRVAYSDSVALLQAAAGPGSASIEASLTSDAALAIAGSDAEKIRAALRTQLRERAPYAENGVRLATAKLSAARDFASALKNRP